MFENLMQKYYVWRLKKIDSRVSKLRGENSKIYIRQSEYLDKGVLGFFDIYCANLNESIFSKNLNKILSLQEKKLNIESKLIA
jgi:hypothetical protein